MDPDVLDLYLQYLMVNHDAERIECNYCSRDDYIFAESTYLGDGVARRLLKHLYMHHPGDFIEPVTDREIAEVFGLQSEHWSPDRPDEIPVSNPEEGA